MLNFFIVIYVWYVFVFYCFFFNNLISVFYDYCIYFLIKIKFLMYDMCLDSKFFFFDLMVYDLIIDKGLGLILGFY